MRMEREELVGEGRCCGGWWMRKVEQRGFRIGGVEVNGCGMTYNIVRGMGIGNWELGMGCYCEMTTLCLCMTPEWSLMLP